MTKIKRSLSGCFFRYQNPVNNKWENWCFEDLPKEKQDEILNSRDPEWVKSLCKILADTLNEVSEITEITKEKPEEDGSN